MKLLEYFKEFQAVSVGRHFSANARSLYYALLEEFDAAFYPAEMFIRNTRLQDIAGINSTHSFDSARNALINAKLITHKKQYYKLLPPQTAESVGKVDGKSLESGLGLFSIHKTDTTSTTTPTTTAAATRTYAREALPGTGPAGQALPPLKSSNSARGMVVGESGKSFCEGLPSAEVMAAWKRGNGVVLNLYQLQQLGLMEVQLGTAELVRQIKLVSLRDNRAGLTFSFFEKVRKDVTEPVQVSAGKYDGEDLA